MPKIVIDIPDELKSVAQPFLAFVNVVSEAVAASRGGKAVDYGAIERRFSDASAGIERAGHEAVLQALDVDARQVLIGGQLHRRVGRYPGSYRTVAGEVTVERSLYRPSGARNGATVDTISIRAGAVGEGWLPQAARGMSHLLSKETSRDAAETVQELGRLQYSRSSFEAVGHLVGELYRERHAEIEDVMIEEYEPSDETRGVSVALDRVSVPMEEPRKRPVGRPRKGAAKKPCQVVYRMAYCATLTMHDAQGEALHTFRYGRMPGTEGDPGTLLDQIDSDLRGLLRKAPGLNIGLLGDGAHEIWNLLEARFNEDTLAREVWKLVDFWHVVEKLAPAARVVYGADGARALARWKMTLLNRVDGPSQVLRELLDSGKESVRVGDNQPVREAITYFVNHHERMNYAEARRCGIPIGSGNVEATCKTLVTLRMKRPGARWKRDTGEHILQLRALTTSDRWDAAMTLLFEKLRRPVRRAG